MGFHEGELAVQARVGVSKQASRVGASIHAEIPPLAKYFLAEQPFIFVASVDKKGQVWPFLLTGEIGFAKAVDGNTLQIKPDSIDELLVENLQTNDQIGILAIEFETRRRMRINGRAWVAGEIIFIQTEEVFSNCPKYIQARVWEWNEVKSKTENAISASSELTENQMVFIRQADTFIIASYHQRGGADASHRGGNPGFIQVKDPQQLIFPDYSGNMMFQTLGNLQLNPNCGLLFYDFSNGRILQLTGKAKINWDREQLRDFAGAERMIEFELIEVRESRIQTNLSWNFVENSPFNPK
jgi:predicted pyridoxine 5'-phosphate oxidase superfamily flavin-nucleotide-binding protein